MLELLAPAAQDALIKLIDDRVAEQLLQSRPPVASGSPWLTVAEAAQYLRTSPGAIYKRIARGQLPAHRPEGSQILLRRDDVAPTGPAEAAPMMTTNIKWPREAGTSGAVTPGGQS